MATHTNQSNDIGRTRWFRLLVGVLWILVVALAAVGLYTLNLDQLAWLYTNEYLLSTLLFGAFLLTVTVLIFRKYPLRRPGGGTESYSPSQ